MGICHILAVSQLDFIVDPCYTDTDQSLQKSKKGEKVC